MRDPLDAEARTVPSIGRRQLILVDGRTFAISDEAGDMTDRTHGLVHDDLRHLSRLTLDVSNADVELLASSAPSPLSAVTVSRVSRHGLPHGAAVLTRRRWVGGGLREDIHLHNVSPHPQTWMLMISFEADFAHVFDVKAGLCAPPGLFVDRDGWWEIEEPGGASSTRVHTSVPPDQVDVEGGTLAWRLDVDPRADVVVSLTAQPVCDGDPAHLMFPLGTTPFDALPVQRLNAWDASVPRVTSPDPRLSIVVDQALADIAALRIIDIAHPDRPVVAAGAPWFMTLFGRDSLLTSWMTLPFDGGLAAGVLATLAELQGRHDDDVAEEQPGKILHELRRHGGGGPFSARQRYFGTVDATPLFVMLAAEAHRWGALDEAQVDALAPSVGAALQWILTAGDTDGDGFVDYRRRNPRGLSNQGWKDSWDGVTFADGALPVGPIALVEVQGYAYAALRGAAELSSAMAMPFSADELLSRAEALREHFNEAFWDDRGWFAIALDGDGRRVDSLTTNPGHALWTGIADPALADIYLDRLAGPAMWTGWGLRTLADTMDAYDPLSYHNGSVWPHDTALCAAGAARYGRWDVVDKIVNGALDAAMEFGGRPPELFAGIDRDEAPMPVSYPSSCSPQAWSSASILLLVRTMLDLRPDPGSATVRVMRPDLSSITDLLLERLQVQGRRVDVDIVRGVANVRPSASP